MGRAEGFEFVSHTADVAVVVRGGSLEELFENAGLALFTLLVDPGCVREAGLWQVEVESSDLESLLVGWRVEGEGGVGCLDHESRKASEAMPDIHWGYGFPVGGVAAMRLEGVSSPQGGSDTTSTQGSW